MIEEGRAIAKIHPNMVVKIPMTVEGLKAVKVLTAEGIKTNVTLVFSANQALLVARAGATYSPFLGRLDDISTRGTDLIAEIAEMFAVAGIETEIIAWQVYVTQCTLQSVPCRSRYCYSTLQGNRADDTSSINRSGVRKIPG